MRRYQILIYRRTTNLGDAIQTIAMSRLLPGRLIGVFRDAADRAEAATPFVVNGWLGGPVPPRSIAIFAGVFVGTRSEEQLVWMRQSTRPIGARDPYTQQALSACGTAAEMIGCATLTFRRYSGTRAGRFAIDVDSPPAGFDLLTNRLARDLPWPEQWALARARLDTLRRAEVVATSRLHVALPCLAFGTPVIIRRGDCTAQGQPERFTILDALGVPSDEAVVSDVSAFADRYLRWLSRQLNVDIQPRGRRGRVEAD